MSKTTNPQAFVYNGTAILAGQYVRLASEDASKVLEVNARPPHAQRNPSLIGVWYRADENGKLVRHGL